MKQILIGRQIAYAAKAGGGTIAGINEINLLDTGAIAVFTDRNELITVANAGTILDDRKAVIIAVGNQVNTSSKTMITLPIPRIGTDYSYKAYTAPVKQVKYIGYDGTTGGTALNYPTLVIGDSSFMRITDTTEGLRNYGFDTKRYEVVVKGGDTAATITARMITTINNDPDSIVVAAGISSNTGISLTAKNFGETFDMSVSGILSNASLVEAEGSITGVAVAPTYGEGTYDSILSLEDLSNIERGDTNRLVQSNKWFSVASLAVAGLTYDMYTMYWSGKRPSALVEQHTYNELVQVALPLGGTTPKTAFETIMAEVFAGTVSTSPVETGS